MGNQCSCMNENRPIEKADIFDFRFKGEENGEYNKMTNYRDEEEETNLPAYNGHLVSLQRDPYEDKYAFKGDSMFVLNKKTPNTAVFKETAPVAKVANIRPQPLADSFTPKPVEISNENPHLPKAPVQKS